MFSRNSVTVDACYLIQLADRVVVIGATLQGGSEKEAAKFLS